MSKCANLLGYQLLPCTFFLGSFSSVLHIMTGILSWAVREANHHQKLKLQCDLGEGGGPIEGSPQTPRYDTLSVLLEGPA